MNDNEKLRPLSFKWQNNLHLALGEIFAGNSRKKTVAADCNGGENLSSEFKNLKVISIFPYPEASTFTMRVKVRTAKGDTFIIDGVSKAMLVQDFRIKV